MNEEDFESEVNPHIQFLVDLWNKIEQVTGQSVEKGSPTLDELTIAFSYWYNRLSLTPKQKHDIYKYWSTFTANDQSPHVIKMIVAEQFFNKSDLEKEHSLVNYPLNQVFLNKGPIKNQWNNPHFKSENYNASYMRSATYDYLLSMREFRDAPVQDSFTLPHIEIDGDWKILHIQDVSPQDKLVELGKIIGLDLIVSDYENLPNFKLKFSDNGPDDCTNAQLSMMMLKCQTRELRKMAKLLYPVLKPVLNRKLVIDRVIYFLVCNLHRCASAIFWDCCPKSVAELFEENRFIPLYIPFNQDGYWFDINAIIETDVPFQLACWKQKTKNVLKDEFYQPNFQLNEEIDCDERHYPEKVEFKFQWRIARVAIIIQSTQKLDRITFRPTSDKAEIFDCQNPEEILLHKDKNSYWYSVSLLATHDFQEALFSNQLYHAHIMHLVFPFLCNLQQLTLVGKRLAESSIKIYSRAINEDMAKYSIRSPHYFD